MSLLFTHRALPVGNFTYFEADSLKNVGFHKAVTLNHGTLAASDAFNEGATDPNRVALVLNAVRQKRCFVLMPSFRVRVQFPALALSLHIECIRLLALTSYL